MRYGFGIDLGGTTVKLAYFDETGKMLDKWEIPTVVANHGQEILPDIAYSIRKYMDRNEIDPADIIGVGLGVPGPVDNAGVVNKCVNLGWGVFNVAETLSNLMGFPVKAGNDANVAALGEFWKGSGAGSKNMVLVTLGTGVGGGIVINGRLLHGTHGSAAEIGHMVLNRDETERCNCGKRGCAEQYCSATGIVRMALKLMQSCSDDSMMRSIQPLTCRDIFECSQAGDQLAWKVLDQYYAYLGEFLANLCNVVDPEVVVIGGGVSRAGQQLLTGARPHFKRYVFHANTEARFALASLGNDAGAYGAFKLILDTAK